MGKDSIESPSATNYYRSLAVSYRIFSDLMERHSWLLVVKANRSTTSNREQSKPYTTITAIESAQHIGLRRSNHRGFNPVARRLELAERVSSHATSYSRMPRKSGLKFYNHRGRWDSFTASGTRNARCWSGPFANRLGTRFHRTWFNKANQLR